MAVTYPFLDIESKWTRSWEEQKLYEPSPDSSLPKYYALTMLPYPSGDLHIGHWYAMAPSDAIARFQKMLGHNVFFPIGFDAFGLPAENAAIKNNIHPKEWTYQNMDRMRRQLKSMGSMFAWDHEVVTCNPDYYRWSQWIFLKLYEHGLVYREFAPVDFCTQCNTTLAREQVVGDQRVCERCESPVIKKALNQWKLSITHYAEELLSFEGLEWPERVKQMQRNWIGKSEGVQFEMTIEGHPQKRFQVFTTRPDTVFGMSFCVLAPEHPLVPLITTEAQKSVVEHYCKEAICQTEVERCAENKEKTGVFTGSYAINPMNQQSVPIWIADYVLGSYGTGAIMAVPAHDQRDFEFARQYNLPIPVVIHSHGESIPISSEKLESAVLLKEGSVTVNSPGFDGLVWPESFEKISEFMENKKIGKRCSHYRLHDWLISRQRMWGTPIPMIHCSHCGTMPVAYQDLPVLLPDDAAFKPTGESPLKSHQGFLNVSCPKCGEPAERETDTMDTFICSSWYHYAYVSPYWKSGQTLTKEDTPWDPELIKKWLPVDQYTGGIEHATMHLLYFRFFTKALADMGLLPFREPATRLFNQGMILGEDYEKMSKSRGNVVNPDPLVQQYGADAVRLYLMFIGPWDAGGPWNSHGIEGVVRFVNDVWYLASPVTSSATAKNREGDLLKAMHQTLKKVTDDYQQFKFNTAVASLMSYRNTLKKLIGEEAGISGSSAWSDAMDGLILMLAPMAPFLSEELWQQRHPGASVHVQSWPIFDPLLVQEHSQTVVIQVNGKLRERIEISIDLSSEEIQKMVIELPKIQEFLGEKPIKKMIVVQNKLVNIVV